MKTVKKKFHVRFYLVIFSFNGIFRNGILKKSKLVKCIVV